MLVQLREQSVLVDIDTIERFFKTLVRLEREAECLTQIPQDCRVREIALEPGDWQLRGEVGVQRDRHTKITFSVLEVDGVDLVWHR